MPRYSLRGGKWANPFKIGRDGTRQEVIAKYGRHLYDSGLINDLDELRGRDLACWCAPQPCHGNVLLRRANGPTPGFPVAPQSDFLLKPKHGD